MTPLQTHSGFRKLKRMMGSPRRKKKVFSKKNIDITRYKPEKTRDRIALSDIACIRNFPLSKLFACPASIWAPYKLKPQSVNKLKKKVAESIAEYVPNNCTPNIRVR